MMKFLTTCLLGLMMIVMFTFSAQSADAQHRFQQQVVQRVVVPQFVQPYAVQQQFVQPYAVQQQIVVPQFQRQRVVVQQPFVQKQRIVTRQRVSGFGGSSNFVQRASLLGAFGRDAQRFSAVRVGIGF